MIIGINTAVTYPDPFTIGRQRENEVTQVQFDVSEWVRTYGPGTLALSVQRRRDRVPYPVPIAIVDGAATWTISNTDTAQDGHIKAQLTYMVGTKIKKSKVYMLTVKASLPEDGLAPDGYMTWLEVLQTMTAETAANAQTATEAAESASALAASASESAQSAASDAQTASTAAESAEESADEAEHYANLAAQHAERAGYVIFDVDEQTGEAIATVTDVVDETMTFFVDEANGDLEVTLI